MDRIEALEAQVRQLTSRLAGWVEAQLVQSVEDRRDDMTSFRSELQLVVDEQLAGMRAEAGSVLAVATSRLEVAQKQLSERLDRVAELAASTGDDDRLGALELQVGQRLALVHEHVEVELAAAGERQRAEVGGIREELLSRLLPLDGASAAMEALDQRLRSAMSRLSDSVEAKLQDSAQGRRNELDALVEDITALKAEGYASPARIEAFEQRVKAAMSRLTDSVEKRLAETGANREAGLGALRLELTEAIRHEVTSAAAGLSDSVDARLAELAAARAAEIDGQRAELATTAASLGERVEAAGRSAGAVAGSLAEVQVGLDAATARTDGLEQRVKAAVGRLAESVESRLAELAAGQSAELRTEIDTAAAALRAGMGHVQERLDAVEERDRESEGRVGTVVEARLGEIVERRCAELDELRAELEATLAAQLREARSEIGTAVAEAHRRFVVSVDKLHERMNVVADQAVAAHAAATKIETLDETLTSDGRRIEALEIHTRRTDARLGDVVEAKLAEQRGAEREGVQEQLRAALDAHLTETRAEVTLALGHGRQELIDGAARLDERQAAFEGQAAAAAARLEERMDAYGRQAADAAAGLEAIDASVSAGLREAEERLRKAVEAKLAAFDAVAAQLAEGRAELASTVASLTRSVGRVQDQVQAKVTTLAEQVDGMARAAALENSSLAPLRSDLRLLQAQVAELAELVTTVRPRRQATAVPAKKAVAKKAVAKKAVAKKAAPAKAPRPRRSQ